MNLLRSVCRHLAATLLLLVSLLVGGASASAGHPLVLVGTSTLASSDAGVQDPDLQLRPEVTHVAREASGAHARGRTRGARPSEVAADQARSLVTSDVAAEGALTTPRVGSAKLQNIIDDLYKGTTNPGRVGTGTTADAIRYELRTGEQVFGRSHIQKGEDYVRGIENWLKRNPDAAFYDRLVGRSVADDLLDALGRSG